MEFELDGARVYCEITGSGTPVMLLHGWGGRCESWAPVARDLAGRHTVINLDFPGHGRSSDPPEPWSVSEYADMTAKLIGKAGFERVDIVAHSFGGRVALCLAANHPHLAARMVLSGVPAIKKAPSGKAKFKSGVYKALKSALDSPLSRALASDERVDGAIEALQNKFGSADYKQLSPSMRKTFVRVVNQDLSGFLPVIASETLLFWGDDDTAAPVWIAREMEKIMPDAGLVVMPGAGHFAYLDRYADFKAVLGSFLN